MSNNSFAPYLKRNTSFVVRNIIIDSNKTVRIFNYPIPVGTDRDLLAIPGVAESDIRASLLKGEILHKLLAHEIEIILSDIDLLQFNVDQRIFLEQSGISVGLTVSDDQLTFIKYEDVELVGAVDDANTTFSIPSGKFIQQGKYKIIVYKNGVKQAFLDDFIIAESGGPGTGYDTVILAIAPTTTPAPDDLITADYYIVQGA